MKSPARESPPHSHLGNISGSGDWRESGAAERRLRQRDRVFFALLAAAYLGARPLALGMGFASAHVFAREAAARQLAMAAALGLSLWFLAERRHEGSKLTSRSVLLGVHLLVLWALWGLLGGSGIRQTAEDLFLAASPAIFFAVGAQMRAHTSLIAVAKALAILLAAIALFSAPGTWGAGIGGTILAAVIWMRTRNLYFLVLAITAAMGLSAQIHTSGSHQIQVATVAVLVLTVYVPRLWADKKNRRIILAAIWISSTASVALLMVWWNPIAVGAREVFEWTETSAEVALGGYVGSDLTLSQRSYEVRRVTEELASRPGGIALGLGFGSTIDLSSSPDARTLANAGRSLAAVDDAHTLHAHVLMKVGIIGLLAFMTFLLRRAYAVLWNIRSSADNLEIRLATFVVLAAYAADGLTAATHLFTVPFPWIALGALTACRSTEPIRRRRSLSDSLRVREQEVSLHK